MQKPGYGIVVATSDGKTIGLIAWSRSQMFLLDKARLYIEALVVDEGYRGMGIGKKLMNFVEDIARKLSPCNVDLTSGLRRAKSGSHEFYKKLGYQHDGPRAKLFFRKEL